MITEDGRIGWLHDIAHAIKENEQSPKAKGLLVDATEQKPTYMSQRKIQARLFEVQEQEKKRIARELHDNISQKIAILTIELDLLEKKLPTSRRAIKDQIKGIRDQASEVATSVHQLAYQLHSAKLEHLGLNDAISSYCEEISEQHQLSIGARHATDIEADIETLPSDVSLALYRVFQEAVHNAVKHSHCKKIAVNIGKKACQLTLTIEDNGKGFDHDSMDLAGLGLISMKERMDLNGGSLTIITKIGLGTQIIAKQPLFN
ncbi:MAG: sensor histidine kinase [Kordiimonadaceae bacterium]|nr:sensor histidine kinase [Kordiimonadaceae bacterium]